MAGRCKPMTKDEAFRKIVDAFPTCEVKSISDTHKYITYCLVTRVCKICGNEWSTKVSNALHLGSGCKRCSTLARVRENQFYNIDYSVPGVVYRVDAVDGSYSKVGFTQNLKKRMKFLRHDTPFAVKVPVILYQGCALTAFELESRLLEAGVSAGFAGFCGATEWLLSESLDKILLDR